MDGSHVQREGRGAGVACSHDVIEGLAQLQIRCHSQGSRTRSYFEIEVCQHSSFYWWYGSFGMGTAAAHAKNVRVMYVAVNLISYWHFLCTAAIGTHPVYVHCSRAFYLHLPFHLR